MAKVFRINTAFTRRRMLSTTVPVVFAVRYGQTTSHCCAAPSLPLARNHNLVHRGSDVALFLQVPAIRFKELFEVLLQLPEDLRRKSQKFS